MAACITLHQGKLAASNLTLYGPTNNVEASQFFVRPMSWLSEATLTDGVYSCPAGTYLLLTTTENSSVATTQTTWTAADGLEVGWSIAAIWLSVAAIMFLAKIVKWGTDHDSNES